MVAENTVFFLVLSIFTFAAFALKALSDRVPERPSSLPGLRIKTQATIVVLTMAMWLALIFFH